MELTDTIAFIRRYNAWRRGYQGIEQPQPYKIGQALDSLCNHAERLERELATERALADRLAGAMLKHCEPRHTVDADIEDACQLGEAITAWKEARSE